MAEERTKSMPAPAQAQGGQVSPVLKILLEIGPLAVFFAVYWFSKGDGDTKQALLTATAAFMGALAISLAVTYLLTRTLSRIMILTGAVVGVLGTLTLALGDADFIKLRPTIVNGAFALVLGFGLLVHKRSYLQFVIGELFPMRDEGWMKLTRNWALFFAFMAVLNEVVWRTQSDDTWAIAKTFVYLPLVFVFTISQAPLMMRYAIDEKAADEERKDAG